jgi:hypothetical protein
MTSRRADGVTDITPTRIAKRLEAFVALLLKDVAILLRVVTIGRDLFFEFARIVLVGVGSEATVHQTILEVRK